MTGLPLGTLIEPGSVDDDLVVRRQFQVRSVNGTRRGPFEVDTFAVVSAPVAGTLEFVLAGFPVGRAAEMRAAGVDDENAVRCTADPDAVLLLPLRIHAQGVIRGITDFENRGRLEERTGEKETKEGNEPCTKETSDCTPHQAASALIDLTVIRSDGRYDRRGLRFRGMHGRRPGLAGT